MWAQFRGASLSTCAARRLPRPQANAARHHRPQHCAAPHRRRHHSQRWQQPPAAASSPNNQQETPEDTSALGQPYLSGPYLRSGPQNSIHTAAQQELEQYQQQQRLQQQQKQELAGWTAAEIAAANQETTSTNRMDVYKAIGLSASVCVLAGILDHDWIEQHQVCRWDWAFGGRGCKAVWLLPDTLCLNNRHSVRQQQTP